ncbi:hypothetical protein THAOC_29938, partial [Thalassiosira oceanica]
NILKNTAAAAISAIYLLDLILTINQSIN